MEGTSCPAAVCLLRSNKSLLSLLTHTHSGTTIYVRTLMDVMPSLAPNTDLNGLVTLDTSGLYNMVSSDVGNLKCLL